MLKRTRVVLLTHELGSCLFPERLPQQARSQLPSATESTCAFGIFFALSLVRQSERKLGIRVYESRSQVDTEFYARNISLVDFRSCSIGLMAGNKHDLLLRDKLLMALYYEWSLDFRHVQENLSQNPSFLVYSGTFY